MTNAPQGYKVSEVRYNRAPAQHGILSIDLGAETHHLEITLAEATGSIIATVSDGSRPMPGATVLLMREPIEEEAFEWTLRYLKADKDCHASFTGLLPGTYRLTAYPEGAFWGEDPNLRQRVANGEQVRVSRGQPATLQIRAENIR